MSRTLTIVVVLLALVAGLAGGYWYAQRAAAPVPAAAQVPERKILYYRNPMNPAITSPVPAKDEMGMDYVPVYADEAAPSAERKILYYRNPMNPAITSPVPAKDQMGMDYVPVYADDADASEAPGTVKIDPVTQQNIGVRTVKAERRALANEIRAVGRVGYSEERLAKVHSKTEGWIEQLYIARTGEAVKKNTILLSIYSPQLVATQQEYLLALSNRETLKESTFEDIRRGADELVESARERLKLFDVPPHQIKELEQNKKISKTLHIHSPFDGIALQVGVRQGQYVMPETELYTLADLAEVWAYVDIYEDELPWVREGDKAALRVAGVPGRVFRGRVSYIYPYLESKTRTVKVRLEFDNPGRLLKPDMFADVVLQVGRRAAAVVLPSEAVVRSGEREQVFVVRGPGKFEPREVRLGLASSGLVQILDGVRAGDEVVVSGQFLIDSESKLREAATKMRESVQPPRPEPPGDDLDMSDMRLDAPPAKPQPKQPPQGEGHDHSNH